MIEPEKKGSPWPWILVPVAAVGMFFVLRECRQNLPPAPSPAITVPATPNTPAPADPQPATPEETPAPAPAPQ